MSAQTDALQDYITATRLCDCDDPWLRMQAEEIIAGASTPEEKALKVFGHVRDTVRQLAPG